ncbi:MAG: lysylphosphatidylglycerol synthase transmembrane domain-containing protein [Polyangiales bacterium]
MLLQLVLTAAAFGYLLHISNLPALSRAFSEAPLWSVPSATLTLLAVMFAGTLRWSLLMSAYGARSVPGLGYLFRLQLIGLFYNMMPGAVGGDVLRGVVSRHAFGPQGMSAGLTVVLVERVFGLLALMLLVISVLGFHPIHGLQLTPWMLGAGLLGSVAALLGIALGRRIAPWLPGVLGRRAAELPGLTRPSAFVVALLMSLINQACVGLMGHWTIGPLAPQVSVIDSLVLSPLAFAAIFFPLTVAGAGTRDAAMVALYGLLGVPKESALSASLQILLAYAIVAALGGALSLVTPLREDATAKPAENADATAQ